MRRLGQTDLLVSPIGMGCSQIASLTTRHPPREIWETLEEAVRQGINFFDTADVYGQGDSERMLGKLLRRHRQPLHVCTKAGMTVSGSQGVIRLLKPALAPIARRIGSLRQGALRARRAGEGRKWEAGSLRKRVEGSLRRLGLERLDLFLLHSPSPADLEDGRLYDLLDRLKQEGLIRHHGVSVDTLGDAGRVVEHGRAACLQIPLNVTNLVEAAPALEAATAKGMGVIAREVFAGGNLIPAAVGGIPTSGATEAALAPILRHRDIDTALVGATCRNHLVDNLAVLRHLEETGQGDG